MFRFISEYAEQDIRSVWVGLQAAGYDLQLDRVYPAEPSQLINIHSSWSFEQDKVGRIHYLSSRESVQGFSKNFNDIKKKLVNLCYICVRCASYIYNRSQQVPR